MRASRLLLSLAAIAPIAIALAVTFGSGCDSSPTAPAGGDLTAGCLVNTDCNAPLICAFRRCHTECRDDRDCQKGQRCVLGDRPFRVCQLDDERDCQYNSECPGGELCGIDDKCRDQCAADRDCVPQQTCVTGTCASNDELVDGGLPRAQNGQTTGQPCSYTSECPEGLVCREGICNFECLGDVDCAPFTCTADHRCTHADAGVVYCTPGEQVSCACPGTAVMGVQVCKDDASGYGLCMGCP